MRTIIIGDIHGCFDEFAALLDKVGLREDADRLILLGDLFDRGPKSWEVFQKARRLGENMGSRFILIKGSHERFLMKPQLSNDEKTLWHRIGLDATEQSFRAHGAELYDSLPWLQQHARLFFDKDGIRCVHAGLHYEDLSSNDEYTLLVDHDITKRNEYCGKLTITGHIHLDVPVWYDGSRGPGNELPYGINTPLPEKGVICLDTGCVDGRSLTAMILENGSFMLEKVPRGLGKPCQGIPPYLILQDAPQKNGGTE